SPRMPRSTPRSVNPCPWPPRKLRMSARSPSIPAIQTPRNLERTLMASQIADAVQRALARLKPELAEPLMTVRSRRKNVPAGFGHAGRSDRNRPHADLPRAREFIARRLEPVLGPQLDGRW